MNGFAAKWFALYYPILGCIFLTGGIGLIVKTEIVQKYLIAESKSDQPPAVPRTILRYFFLFTLPCLVLSLIPFSWPELLFSIWSLIIVYLAGIQLVRWPQTRQSIRNHPQKLARLVKICGAIMLAVAPVMFLLCYLVIQRL